MKNKYIVLLVTVLLCNVTFSQNEQSENYSELKLNGLSLILGAFDMSYEHTLSSESSIGLSVFLPFDDEVYEDTHFYLSPYYRLFFGRKHAAGFFIEGFGMLNSIDRYNSDLDIYDDDIIDFALGVGVGSKWVTNNNFIAELNLGFARNLFNNSEDYDNKILGKIGLTLGYRF